MVNSNNQDPFYKKTIQNLHWNIVFTFSLVAFTAVLSERLGSTDGAELSTITSIQIKIVMSFLHRQ